MPGPGYRVNRLCPPLCQPRNSSPQRASVRGSGFSNPRERSVYKFRGFRVRVRTSSKRNDGCPRSRSETWDPSRKCRQTNLERNALGLKARPWNHQISRAKPWWVLHKLPVRNFAWTPSKRERGRAVLTPRPGYRANRLSRPLCQPRTSVRGKRVFKPARTLGIQISGFSPGEYFTRSQ
jgi:hypothetical protein